MSIETKVMEQMKAAMKAKDKTALEALRAIKAEILLFKTSGKGEEIPKDKEIALLQKMIKQRKEAAEQFSANDRKEQAEKELAQAKVIESFLPKQLTSEELEAALKEILTKIGATSPQDMGKAMGAANKQLAGRAAGKDIANKVKKLLNQ